MKFGVIFWDIQDNELLAKTAGVSLDEVYPDFQPLVQNRCRVSIQAFSMVKPKGFVVINKSAVTQKKFRYPGKLMKTKKPGNPGISEINLYAVK